jgi:prepilin-type N-terminal cleavage/methylation domain-containing protein
MRKQARRQGFTLVELSVVLVVIALITGGIVAGKSLVRSSELSKIAREQTMYISAVQQFRARFKSLPGDMANATQYWGIKGGTTGNDTTCYNVNASGLPTCNGNGDQQVSDGNDEQFLVWQHLSNAGLLAVGGYTGKRIGTGSSVRVSTPGTNIPASAVASVAGYSFRYLDTAGSGSVYSQNYKHVISYGDFATVSTDTNIPNAAFTCAEGYALDKKFDDGRPAQGAWMAQVSGGAAFGSSSSCVSSSSRTDYSGVYRANLTAVGVAFMVKTGF